MRIDVSEIIKASWPVCVPYKNWSIDVNFSDIVEVSSPDYLCPSPQVSVVVVTFQQVAYIAECLESICRQRTAFQYEIIVGEDCSTDGTRAICFEFQRKYPDKIRLVYSAANVGPIANIARTSRLVRGKYVALCEGDDFWCDNYKLQKQFAYLESHKDVSICHTACFQQYESYSWARYPYSKATMRRLLSMNCMDAEQQKFLLLQGNMVSTATVLFTKESFEYAVEEMIWLERKTNWLPSGDFLIWYYCLEKGRMAFLPERMAVRRTNAGSLTAIVDNRKANVRRLGDLRNFLALGERLGCDELIHRYAQEINLLIQDVNRGRSEFRNLRDVLFKSRNPFSFLARRFAGWVR